MLLRESAALVDTVSGMRPFMTTIFPRKVSIALLAIVVALPVAASGSTPEDFLPPPPVDAKLELETYAELAYRAYSDAYQDALHFQATVDEFIDNANDDADEYINKVRDAWLRMRPSYGRTEAFRFYEGPIDFGKRPDGTQGPELLLNSWPVNEAYIDYVEGNPKAGIINDPSIPITRATLMERNGRDDEAEVTTGFHAIEFLLWGQDLNPNGPGHRPARDFASGLTGERRRTYLKVTTDLLVDNLKFVVDEWAPGKQNYRARFLKMSPRESIAHMLTGLATLAGFELAAERLATPLDSGSQEDEHSCFSDTTHIDILANVTGISDVYFGRGRGYQGTGLSTLLAERNPQINERIKELLARSLMQARSLDIPFDRTLTTPAGSPQRAKVEGLVTSLQGLARMFKVAGQILGVNIVVTVEIEH
jgi:putative iron-regulated protein